MNILVSFSVMTDSLSEDVKKIRKYLVSYTSNIQNYRQQASNVFQIFESAYVASIKDNNLIRKKFGLDQISIGDFLPPDFDDMGLISKSFGGSQSLRKSSVCSMNQYYDAESGLEEDDDSDSSSYNSSETEHITIDQSSIAYDDFENDNSPVDTKMAKNDDFSDLVHNEELKVSADENSGEMESFYSTSMSETVLKTIVRRNKLPHPTISMDNLNVMSILRNYVPF